MLFQSKSKDIQVITGIQEQTGWRITQDVSSWITRMRYLVSKTNVVTVDPPRPYNVNFILDTAESTSGVTGKLTESNHLELIRLQQLATDFGFELTCRAWYELDSGINVEYVKVRVYLCYPEPLDLEIGKSKTAGELWSGLPQAHLTQIFLKVERTILEHADTITNPYS